MQPYPRLIISRPFHGLRNAGLTPLHIPQAMGAILMDCAQAEDAIFEINERSQCPTFSMTRQLERRGIELVFGTESVDTSQIGTYNFAQHLLTQLLHAVVDNAPDVGPDHL